MENKTLYLALLTMFMTSALGVVIYCGMFSYSFKRKKLFVLRLICSLIVIGSTERGRQRHGRFPNNIIGLKRWMIQWPDFPLC